LKQNLKLNLINENTENILQFQKEHKEKEKL